MTRTKSTKRALLMSALVLIMCVSMLVGSTFAWFTDTASTGVNTIQSGTLKVDLENAAGDSIVGEALSFVKAAGAPADETILWEPGCTYELTPIYVHNEGNLALKYKIVINGVDGNAKLLEAIEWTVKVDGAEKQLADLAAFEGHLEANEKSGAVVLVGYMKKEAGNEYQGLTANGISITVVATQDTIEFDSEDNQYDQDASYPDVTVVSNATDLVAALAAGEDVVLSADVTVDSTMTIPKNEDVTLNLNGNDLNYAVSNTGASAIITNNGELSIIGKGTIKFVAANPDMQSIPKYATNTITNEGTLIIGEGVVVENGSDGGASYAVDNKGVFILDGGTLIGERCALRIAKYNQDNVKFIMNSGLVKAQKPAWIQLPNNNPAVAPNISVEINGGTFETTNASSADNDLLYTYSFGNSHANTSIVINGGNFLGGTVSIGSGYYADVPALIINGGNFDYDVLQYTSDDTTRIIRSAN